MCWDSLGKRVHSFGVAGCSSAQFHLQGGILEIIYDSHNLILLSSSEDNKKPFLFCMYTYPVLLSNERKLTPHSHKDVEPYVVDRFVRLKVYLDPARLRLHGHWWRWDVPRKLAQDGCGIASHRVTIIHWQEVITILNLKKHQHYISVWFLKSGFSELSE